MSTKPAPKSPAPATGKGPQAPAAAPQTSTPASSAPLKLRAPNVKESAQSLGMMLSYANPTKAEVEAWFVTHKINRKRALEICEHLMPTLKAVVSAPEAAQSGNGKAKPAEGEKRTYRAQQLGDTGDVYLRLPLGVMGIKKGDLVEVAFGGKSIGVTNIFS